MKNYIENIALLGAQIEALQAVVSKSLISDEIKKSISSLQAISINVENIDISTSIHKATQAIGMIESSPYLLKLEELSKLLISMEVPSITKNSVLCENIKGYSTPSEIPKYEYNRNFQMRQRPTVINLRQEGNDLVGRL